MIFDFWSPWGLYGHPKFHVLPKNAANQAYPDGYNFFVFQDNWKILSAGERYWLGQKKYFCHFRVSQTFFFNNSKLRCQNSLLGTWRGGPFFWPIVFPDQFTIKSKKKPKGVISFFRVFLQFGTPYFSKF